MLKIKSVLKGSEKDRLNQFDALITVHNHRAVFNQQVPNAMEQLMESMITKKQITLHYRSLKDEN